MSSLWWQKVTNRKLRPRVEQLEGRDLPSAYSVAVLQDSPVAYWRLGEAAGPTAFDASGHNATGTYFNGVLLGQPGGLAEDTDTAARFDGQNDHVRFANPLANDFTIEAWVKTTANSLTGTEAYQGNGLVWSDVSGVANDWVLSVLNNRAAFHAGNPGGSIIGTTPVNDGNFHHVAVTRVRGGEMRLYVDGLLEATGVTGDVALNANPFVVVGGNTLDGRYFNGTIDEVAVYDRALSVDSVAAHFRAAHEPLAGGQRRPGDDGRGHPGRRPRAGERPGPGRRPADDHRRPHPRTGQRRSTTMALPPTPPTTSSSTPPPSTSSARTQFTYTVSDGLGGTATATVTVTVVNEAPQVDAGGDATLDEGGVFERHRRVQRPGRRGRGRPWWITGTRSGTQPLALNPDKTFALSHTYDDSGLYQVTVEVTDRHGATGGDTLTVTVANVAPTAVFSGPGSVSEGGTATVDVRRAVRPVPGRPGGRVPLQLTTSTGTARGTSGTGRTAGRRRPRPPSPLRCWRTGREPSPSAAASWTRTAGSPTTPPRSQLITRRRRGWPSRAPRTPAGRGR